MTDMLKLTCSHCTATPTLNICGRPMCSACAHRAIDATNPVAPAAPAHVLESRRAALNEFRAFKAGGPQPDWLGAFA